MWYFQSTSCTLQRMLALSAMFGDYFFTVVSVQAYPMQEHAKVEYENSELLNRTQVHSTSLNCLSSVSSSLPNETSDKYHMETSIGDGLYVFGFIGLFLVLKSLVAIINMVENKPEDNEYVLSKCKALTTINIPMYLEKQIADKKDIVTITPPNSPSLCKTLNTFMSSPGFYSEKRGCYQPNLDEDHTYEARCAFSSPEGSTRSLV